MTAEPFAIGQWSPGFRQIRNGPGCDESSILVGANRAKPRLGEFEKAQIELVSEAVILTDGKAGTVENVWLDEMHGLRISIKGHDGKWPISTVKFAQTS